MIPTIGLMVAAVGINVALYILARMAEPKPDGAGTICDLIRVFAGVTSLMVILILLLLAADLLLAGDNARSLLDR